MAIMAALLPKYEGRINLIYADPPFFTNRKFTTRIGRGEDSRKPDLWQLAEGYHDNWSDLDAYLDFLYQRLALMYRLLAPNGTLYLHLDWHADAYARLILDELFGGTDHLLNEIIWAYHGPSPIRTAFNRKHDTILSYVKGKDYTFNADAVREPYNQNTVNTFKSSRKAGFGKIPNLERGKVHVAHGPTRFSLVLAGAQCTGIPLAGVAGHGTDRVGRLCGLLASLGRPASLG
jgi:site-specific DNA-methyltransferase (adenine-specific)